MARSNALASKRTTATRVVPGKAGQQQSDQLDVVLDKISQRGIESLTSDERRLLEEMSKRLRRQ